MPTQHTIQTRELNLWYGDFQALKDVNVNIRPGIITDNIVCYKLRDSFRGNAAIADARSPTLGNIDQRLKIAAANTAHLYYMGIYVSLFKLNLDALKHI